MLRESTQVGKQLIDHLIQQFENRDARIVYWQCYSFMEVLYVIPEILILGCGKRMGRVSNELRDYLRSNGIKLEAIDTVIT